jgi:hypothetical protein
MYLFYDAIPEDSSKALEAEGRGGGAESGVEI